MTKEFRVAHASIEFKGLRNPVEGGFGTAKTQGGFDSEKCRLSELEPQALNALFQAVARNLQTTLNDEFVKVRAHMQANKEAKQARRSEEATRKQEQNPKDLPHIVEPDSQDGTNDDPAEDDSDDESSVGTLTPPRAPP